MGKKLNETIDEIVNEVVDEVVEELEINEVNEDECISFEEDAEGFDIEEEE